MQAHNLHLPLAQSKEAEYITRKEMQVMGAILKLHVAAPMYHTMDIIIP